MTLVLSHRLLFVLLACACALGAGITWVLLEGQITGNVIQEAQGSYTWTTALCTDTNECIDVAVTCEDGKAVAVKPLSALHAFGDDWEDPRPARTDLCP